MATAPSLFGATPEALQQQRNAALNAEALQYAKLDPFQRATMGIYKGANQLGGAIGGMLGGQDPQMQRMQQRQQLLQGIDTTNPQALMQAAQKASQAGDYQAAQELSTRANALQLQVAQVSKAQEEAARLSASNLKEDKLSTELAALAPDATDADVEAVVRKYGKPEAIFASMTRRQQAKASQDAKAALEADKAAAKVEAAALAAQNAKELVSLRSQFGSSQDSLQRQLLQQRIDDLADKKTAKAEMAEAAKRVSINHAKTVITDVDNALDLVGGATTGLIGSAASMVPGTPAFNLNNRVATIKANLGFDRLQQMRDNSPTGGALGQVAVQELEALQRSVASLEIGQGQEELTKNLGRVRDHYARWLETVQGNVPAKAGGATSGWGKATVVK